MKLYRAIGPVLDSIHRLVLRVALSNGPNWVGLSCPIHLRTETDPVSEALWDFLSSTYKTMDKVQNKPNSSVQHTPSSESFQVYPEMKLFIETSFVSSMQW
jgi:hypothetical protein